MGFIPIAPRPISLSDFPATRATFSLPHPADGDILA